MKVHIRLYMFYSYLLCAILSNSVFVLSAYANHTSQSIVKKKVQIPAGRFTPLFGLDKTQDWFDVAKFEIDVLPVTKSEFEKFLKRKSEWKKNQVFSLYVDQKYLFDYNEKDWKLDAPITYVSWYAATAYCESKGGRLPSTLEWEYVAAASENISDASKDPDFNQKIIDWYNKPTRKVRARSVGQSKPNFYGVYDLHGLIWEWTSDFNTFFVVADNRSDGDASSNNFCGSGSIAAKDKSNYAAFMRYAFRSSLKAKFSTENLGFRCAYTQE